MIWVAKWCQGCQVDVEFKLAMDFTFVFIFEYLVMTFMTWPVRSPCMPLCLFDNSETLSRVSFSCLFVFLTTVRRDNEGTFDVF